MQLGYIIVSSPGRKCKLHHWRILSRDRTHLIVLRLRSKFMSPKVMSLSSQQIAHALLSSSSLLMLAMTKFARVVIWHVRWSRILGPVKIAAADGQKRLVVRKCNKGLHSHRPANSTADSKHCAVGDDGARPRERKRNVLM